MLAEGYSHVIAMAPDSEPKALFKKIKKSKKQLGLVLTNAGWGNGPVRVNKYTGVKVITQVGIWDKSDLGTL